MAFTRPVVGADISAADFGQPVYDSIVAAAQSAWVTVPLQNNWTNVGAGRPPARVCKFATNFAMLHLAIASGLWGAGGCGTIPAGYRPSQTCDFIVRNDTGYGWLNITPSGVIELYQGATGGAGFVGACVVYPLN